jgi:hypothetical protein
LRSRECPEEVYIGGGPAISGDASTVAWWWQHYPNRDPKKDPFVTVKYLDDGTRPIWLDGYEVANHNFGISWRADVIVVSARPLHGRRRQLLVLDLRKELKVQDLTQFVTEFELPKLEDISVSGPGTRVAVGSREQIQVLDIPSGKTVYSSPGRFPKLSPDGMRLAFVKQEHLCLRLLSSDTTSELLPGVRVMGVGSWSPDGRYLLGGAWTRRLAFAKRQVVIDSTTGQYAEIGKLGEGDYGDQFAWVSTGLVTQ